MWECRKCHERLEESFEVCWNCGTSKDGTEDPTFRNADETPVGAAEEETLGPGPDAVEAEIGSAPPVRLLVCPKCRSQDMIPGVRIVDRGDGNWRGNLQVEVYESPDALIFKGAHAGTLRASICGRCGYVELYVSNPQELLEAYKRSSRA